MRHRPSPPRGRGGSLLTGLGLTLLLAAMSCGPLRNLHRHYRGYHGGHHYHHHHHGHGAHYAAGALAWFVAASFFEACHRLR